MVDDAKKEAAPKKKKGNFSQRLLLAVFLLVGAAFLPISLLLMVGMMPSLVAFMAEPRRPKTRALTVMLMNFVACFPFLLMVAFDNPTMEGSYAILSDPVNIVIMFAGAAAGYFLDWTLAGISNIVMTGRARQRLDAIDKRQAELARRWGREVTGEIPLDPDGFPLPMEDGKS